MIARSVIVAAASLAIVASCNPLPGRIQAEHAREFGCQARWVSVRETGPDAYLASGCGFASEWACREGRCTMRDSRAHGTAAP